MKTLKIVFYLNLYLCLFSCKNTNPSEVIITGNIEGVEDGIVVNLRESKGNLSVTIYTDTIQNGKFNFSFIDTIPESKNLTISAGGEGFPPTWLDLWIKPGAKVTITGKDKLLRTWDVKSNVAEQEEHNKYVEKSRLFIIENQKKMRDAYHYFSLIDQSKDKVEKKLYRQKIDSLYAICDSLREEINNRELEQLENNPTYSKVWFLFFQGLAQYLTYKKEDQCFDTDRLINLYNNLPDSEKNTAIGQEIVAYLFPPVVVENGDKMADADLIDLEGNKKNLADYIGKYRLLDFWSVGCTPCVKAIPEMIEVAEKYKDRLVVIGINGDDKNVWIEFSNKNEMAGVNLNDPKGEAGLKLNYGVKGIPHYVLVSPDDIIITSWGGYGKGSLLRKMEELLK